MGVARVALRKQVILGKDSPAIKDKKVAVCQSLSGTGALRISAEFLAQYNPGVSVYCSDPTWGNHHAIFAKAGLKTFKYRYLNKVHIAAPACLCVA
jgi:aspartate/tyrosine/aromatic aminotransferase